MNWKTIIDLLLGWLKRPAAAAQVTPEVEIHVVQPGETLGGIANQYYGDASRYQDIFEANRDVLDDPDTLEVGQRLSIPR